MNFKLTCAVCGVAACGILAHQYQAGHIDDPGRPTLTAQHYSIGNHPEMPEPGDFVREPQVSAVTTGSQLPPAHSGTYFTNFLQPRSNLFQPSAVNSNWTLFLTNSSTNS